MRSRYTLPRNHKNGFHVEQDEQHTDQDKLHTRTVEASPVVWIRTHRPAFWLAELRLPKAQTMRIMLLAYAGSGHQLHQNRQVAGKLVGALHVGVCHHGCYSLPRRCFARPVAPLDDADSSGWLLQRKTTC